ncbi:MAG: asparagine synthase-related protein, partial [Thermodesulfobacteriota bacterium]
KVNCFLSGGWDSRLLAGLLAKKNQVDCTWTTELLGRYSESRIAYTVADHLGINNQFIPPTFLNLISYFHKHRKLVDYSSDTGPWIMSLLEKIPDGHVYVDGFLVDVLLRPDKHVSPFLLECVNTGNIEGAKEYFLNMYLEAGGPFPSVKAGGRPWQKLLKRDFYEEQAEKLKNNINEEFGDAERGQDFVTSFVMKNRQRRCITALPMLLIGNKGPILLPFCDLELVRLCLNIPLEHKISGRLQFFILEKIKNGLGRLISTNSEKSLLHPYLRKRITYDFTRRFLSWGWLYEKAVTQLDKQILEFLYGGENEAKLRLLRFPYQLTRLLFVQEALALNNSKE